MTTDELRAILASHAAWFRTKEGGIQANLSGVNLPCRDLTRADLRRSIFSRSNLRGSDLSDSHFIGSDLSGSDLSYAKLRNSNLLDCDLSGCVFSYSSLLSCNLAGSDCSGSDFSGAALKGSKLSRVYLSGAKGLPPAPLVERIDERILEQVERDPCSFDMLAWHRCGTTHCRGGWAIELAGDEGKQLEAAYGSSVAAALIYAASRPGMRVPDFIASNEKALADLRKCAGK